MDKDTILLEQRCSRLVSLMKNDKECSSDNLAAMEELLKLLHMANDCAE